VDLEAYVSVTENVPAGRDHLADAAAMRGFVAKPHERNAINHHCGATFGANPGIWAATGAVNARIAYSQCRTAIDHDIRRTGDSRASDVVGATNVSVGIGWVVGVVANATYCGHGILLYCCSSSVTGIRLHPCQFPSEGRASLFWNFTLIDIKYGKMI